MNFDEFVKKYNLLQDEEGRWYFVNEKGETEDIFLLSETLEIILNISRPTINKYSKNNKFVRTKKGRLAIGYNLNDLLMNLPPKPKFISDDPFLTEEYSSNNELPPNQVKIGTNKKILWICSKCGWEWKAAGSTRQYGAGCPACAGLVVTPTNNLAATHPDLAEEYSPLNTLQENQVLAGTGKKLKWVCSRCNFNWETTGAKRVQGTGCPACAGKVVTTTNNLCVTHPQLAKEYMPPPKNHLPGNEICAGTNKKLWWTCSVCGYEWQAIGSNRLRGQGCPSCSGHIATKFNNLDLESLYPELAKEYSKKNSIPPNMVKPGTNRKLIWECSTCGYEWKTAGSKRVEGTGCPACAGRVATPKNNLTLTNPELIPEYSNKNLIKPTELLAGSDKKVLWQCSKCGHEWKTKVYHRTKGSGCPKCPRKNTVIITNFRTSYPELAKEYSNRNELLPDEGIIGVSKKLLWKCSKCNHEWQAPFDDRKNGKGCPACAGKVVTETNNLKITHPELDKEYSKRNNLPADKIIAGTTKKLWWECSKCNHEWQAQGYARSKKNTGCPACANKKRKKNKTRF